MQQHNYHSCLVIRWFDWECDTGQLQSSHWSVCKKTPPKCWQFRSNASRLGPIIICWWLFIPDNVCINLCVCRFVPAALCTSMSCYIWRLILRITFGVRNKQSRQCEKGNKARRIQTANFIIEELTRNFQMFGANKSDDSERQQEKWLNHKKNHIEKELKNRSAHLFAGRKVNIAVAVKNE